MELTFREIRPDEVEKEVTQRDQFNSDEVELIEALVREAHQNSLDARAATSPPSRSKRAWPFTRLLRRTGSFSQGLLRAGGTPARLRDRSDGTRFWISAVSGDRGLRHYGAQGCMGQEGRSAVQRLLASRREVTQRRTTGRTLGTWQACLLRRIAGAERFSV